MSEQQHQAEHPHEGDETYGMAIGFRIFEEGGALYLAEAEITQYVDDANALGVTLVFHSLTGIDPTSGEEEDEGEMLPLDIDDDLTRDEGGPLREQAQAIFRQLAGLSEAQLRDYLRLAREEAGAGNS
ncbi:MAG TPA: hypothetical protein VFX98_09995 [Longimicrobiaceae bacterium]|nr:hypothetical protein [Longimicrobiaceae bacterium]